MGGGSRERGGGRGDFKIVCIMGEIIFGEEVKNSGSLLKIVDTRLV